MNNVWQNEVFVMIGTLFTCFRVRFDLFYQAGRIMIEQLMSVVWPSYPGNLCRGGIAEVEIG